MELNKPNFKKWFSWLGSVHIGTDPLKHRPRPFLDWRHLVITWLILLIAISCVHLWLFRNLEKSIAREVENQLANDTPKIDPTELHQIAEYWRQRADTTPQSITPRHSPSTL